MEINKTLHRKLAVSLNGEVWQLLGKTERSEEENRYLIHLTHASYYHWLHAGTEVHQQRGQWLLSHVYATLGFGELACNHAQHCAVLTEKHKSQMRDFDVAYSFEALARSHALLGHHRESAEYKAKARQLGDQIVDDEDKKIFFGDFLGGEWYGVA